MHRGDCGPFFLWICIVYVKLFGSILDSSIWDEDHATVRLWITMLAMADEDGVVVASTSGLAHRGRVTMEECKKGLNILESPDIDSKDQSYAGRRIEKISGGWLLLNYKKYREIRTRQNVRDATRKQRQRTRQRDMSRDIQTDHDVTTEAEAEAEAVGSERSEPQKKDLTKASMVVGEKKPTTALATRDQTWTGNFMQAITTEAWADGKRLQTEAVACFEYWRWRKGLKNRVVFSRKREANTEKLLRDYGLIRCLFAIEGQLGGHPDFNHENGNSYLGYDNMFRTVKGHENVEKCSDWAIERKRYRHVEQYLTGLEERRGWTPSPLDAELFATVKQHG